MYITDLSLLVFFSPDNIYSPPPPYSVPCVAPSALVSRLRNPGPGRWPRLSEPKI